MNIEINEKISQLVDGELHFSEEEPVLRKINQQPELNNKMSRYKAVSHVLKTDTFVMPNQSFLEKINHEIKDDPHYFLPQQPINKTPMHHRWKMTSFAIAASIALVAFIVTQQTDLKNPDFQKLQEQEVLATIPQSTEIENQKVQKVQLTQHERFKAYLQAHSDGLYTHGSLNYQPYARVVTYGQE